MARILIVEDNVDLLAVLRDLLSEEHEVRTARRGEDAVVEAREFVPDLVILDLQLPAMDGIEAGRWIKGELAPRKVPVLALTGLTQEGDSEMVLSSGCCDDYMPKPATMAAIRERVTRLLEIGRGDAP